MKWNDMIWRMTMITMSMKEGEENNISNVREENIMR